MKKSPTQNIAQLFLLLCILLALTNCNPNNQTLYQSKKFTVFSNRVEQDKYVATAKNHKKIETNYTLDTKTLISKWELEKNLNHLPKYESNSTLLTALYNLSLEEVENNILPDSSFCSHQNAKNIATRDIGYSTILSLSITHPQIAINSLMKKVKYGKIIQDEGTGGSWPINSDRMIWSAAAWELYLNTGDIKWLKKAYFIIKNTTEDDLNIIWDYRKHLFKGEASYLNQAEQFYPKWMEPKDIYESYSLNIQSIHFQSLQVLIQMGKLLGKDTQKYQDICSALQKSINNKFWLENKNYFAQFIYNEKDWILSDKSEGLGESLSILWNISTPERQKLIVSNTPVGEFGIPCFSPQIPNVKAYHNRAIWPFVQAFWNQASAKTGNLEAVCWGLSGMIRSTALFLTNKENILLENGNFIQNDNNTNANLKSSSGFLSNYYRILLGLKYTKDQLEFHPVVPREFKGRQKLSGLKYRNTVLDIEVLGFGDQIASYSLDGVQYRTAIVPKDMEGHHKITIRLNNQAGPKIPFKLKKESITPQTPILSYHKNQIKWNKIKNAKHYQIFQNGELLLQTSDTYMSEVHFTKPVEYRVRAIDSLGIYSDYSKALQLFESKYERYLEAEDFLEHRKYKYVNFSNKENKIYYFQVRAPRNGNYNISFLYANGNGPIDSDNKCSTRSFWLNSSYLGSIVFPQRGKGNWNNYGFTNSFTIDLKKGNNYFKISYEDFNKNMNKEINSFRIDKIRLLRKE
nr:hypothetical protein [uncultured Marinifilum sp.]